MQTLGRWLCHLAQPRNVLQVLSMDKFATTQRLLLRRFIKAGHGNQFLFHTKLTILLSQVAAELALVLILQVVAVLEV